MEVKHVRDVVDTPGFLFLIGNPALLGTELVAALVWKELVGQLRPALGTVVVFITYHGTLLWTLGSIHPFWCILWGTSPHFVVIYGGWMGGSVSVALRRDRCHSNGA